MTTPKNEKIWVTCHDSNGKPHYIITSKADRTTYNLWDVSVEPMKKIGKAENPLDLNKLMKLK